MSRWRHHAVVALAASPLLVLLLAWASDGPGGVARAVLAAVLWAAAVALVSATIWRRYTTHLSAIVEEIGAPSPAAARRDVRELRRRAEMCRGERDRLAVLLEDLSGSLGEGLLVLGPDLEVRLVNRVALHFCGVGEVADRAHLLEILRDPEAVQAVEDAAGGQGPRPLVVENPRGLWELRAFPIRDGGAVVLVSDVSLVRRASEFRRRFVQDLSHELRSPLAVLRTTVEALEDEVSPKLAQILVRQVERIDRLTRELYELASIEAGQVELALEPLMIVEVVREVVKDFTPEAERAQVDVGVEVPGELTAIADRAGLYRVLSNLVDNAIKYNRRGGWMKVSAQPVAGGVQLQVADSGDGIPADQLQAVFQRFYRIDRARTPGGGGLGLGLAIVKHMVQHMGGTLTLDSREGVGTVVSLTLPTR